MCTCIIKLVHKLNEKYYVTFAMKNKRTRYCFVQQNDILKEMIVILADCLFLLDKCVEHSCSNMFFQKKKKKKKMFL